MTDLPGTFTELTEELITVNIPLVGHIVRETMGRVPAHVDRDDLTSAGLAALVLAAKSFDQDRGVPFGRYAATRIRGAILDELRSVDWASRSVRRRARQLDETRNRLAASLGRIPSAAEVASALGITLDEVIGNDDDLARAQVLSLDVAVEGAVHEPAADDTFSPAAQLEHVERLSYLRAAITELPERLQVVVEDYFIHEHPMAQIAAKLDVSESRISQLRAQALVLLRDALNTHLDPDLVPSHRRPGGCADRRRESYFAAVASRQATLAAAPRPRSATPIDATA
ncbi:sigma-70 family RNA polymerase sigma factor [Nocardioides sp. Bht2]|uniref:sigma-70 family RNA polymerase sigma factor n=1 Tax=Nocardioides sp. Bht2 TaxID=3392297 RepID=UPI0039B4B9A5